MPEQTRSLPIGLRHRLSIRVDERLTVPAVAAAFTGFADMPPVFATAFLVGFIEWTCIEMLAGRLADGEKSLGTQVDISHVAATPAGMTVTADVELISVEGRKLRFRVECRDESGPIGDGYHERVIVDAQRFMARVAAKIGLRKNV
jgi:fluoroacetyl-CoA thioesterase